MCEIEYDHRLRMSSSTKSEQLGVSFNVRQHRLLLLAVKELLA